MGYSSRKYLLAADDTTCRQENKQIDWMLRDPARHRIPGMAGQRIRMADLAVMRLRRSVHFGSRERQLLVGTVASERQLTASSVWTKGSKQ